MRHDRHQRFCRREPAPWHAWRPFDGQFQHDSARSAADEGLLLVVDAGKLAAGQTYGPKARIAVDGAAWFASDEPLRVDLATAGEPVSLLLPRVADKAASDAAGTSLVGTAWRVRALDGKGADPAVTSTLAFDTDGAVNGNGGRNTFRGDIIIDGWS